MPYSVLSNCYTYVLSRYPALPTTAGILANLTNDGEIGVLFYPKSGLYHFVVVESEGEVVTFSETNYYGDTWSERTLPRSTFVGFYKL